MPPVRSLRDALAPGRLEDFLADIYGRVPHVVRGAAGRFGELFDWSALGQLLASHGSGWFTVEDDGIAHARLNLLHDGDYISPEPLCSPMPGRRATARRVDPATVTGEVRRGATISIDSLEEIHEPVARFAEDVERTLGETVSVNLYASWRGTSGLGYHWDAQDAFVVNVEGRKQWEVFGQTRRCPHYRDPRIGAGRPDAEVVWEGWLGPGDLIYLPRGWWHRVVTPEGGALSLTVRVFRRTGIELLEWLTDELREIEVFREDLPRLADREARLAHVTRLRDALLAAFDGHLLDRYFDDQDARARPRRPSYGLPWTAGRAVLPPTDDLVVRILTPRRPVVRPAADGFEVRAMGRAWSLSDIQLEVLSHLFDGRPCPLARLVSLGAGRLGRDAVRALVADLVLDGLLSVERPGAEGIPHASGSAAPTASNAPRRVSQAPHVVQGRGPGP